MRNDKYLLRLCDGSATIILSAETVPALSVFMRTFSAHSLVIVGICTIDVLFDLLAHMIYMYTHNGYNTDD